MILPTKHLSEERSLVVIGAQMLDLLQQPATVSRLWDELSRQGARRASGVRLSYDWFVLVLDLLMLMGAIDLDNGQIRRTAE